MIDPNENNIGNTEMRPGLGPDNKSLVVVVWLAQIRLISYTKIKKRNGWN